jgi:hypothetical protein
MNSECARKERTLHHATTSGMVQAVQLNPVAPSDPKQREREADTAPLHTIVIPSERSAAERFAVLLDAPPAGSHVTIAPAQR